MAYLGQRWIQGIWKVDPRGLARGGQPFGRRGGKGYHLLHYPDSTHLTLRLHCDHDH